MIYRVIVVVVIVFLATCMLAFTQGFIQDFRSVNAELVRLETRIFTQEEKLAETSAYLSSKDNKNLRNINLGLSALEDELRLQELQNQELMSALQSLETQFLLYQQETQQSVAVIPEPEEVTEVSYENMFAKYKTSNEAVEEAEVEEVGLLPVEEEVVRVPCPQPSADLSSYITRVRITKEVFFRMTYDVVDGELTNLTYEPSVSGTMQRAMRNYLRSFALDNDVTNCTIPIRIKV